MKKKWAWVELTIPVQNKDKIVGRTFVKETSDKNKDTWITMNKYYLIEDIWQIEKLKINSKWGENLEDEI